MKLSILSVVLATIANVVAQYNLAALPLGDRTSICTKTTAFCLNACLQKVSSNLCAVSTMQFSCVCENGSSPSTFTTFPSKLNNVSEKIRIVATNSLLPGKLGTNSASVATFVTNTLFAEPRMPKK